MALELADWTVARAGRLLLVRWHRLPTPEEAQGYREAIFQAIGKSGPSVIICADWRRASVVSTEVAAVLATMLTGASTRIQRSAILLPSDKATFDLQAERLVREAGHPQRRTFRQVDAQLEWLGEELSSDEVARARKFILGGF